MAITIQQQPQAYIPAYNNAFWAATSTQFAQPNFTYTIVCTDMISGYNETYQFPASPTGPLTFNSVEFTKIVAQNFIQINLSDFQVCTGCVRQIRVNIGETYGAGTPVYYPNASPIFIIIWNASLRFLTMQSYDFTNYVTDTSVPRVRWLSDILPEKVFTNRSNLFYKLTADVSSSCFQIDTYTAAGAFIATSLIYEPAGGTYDLRMVSIDMGLKGMVGVVPDYGANPIITPTVAYYNVFDTVITGFVGPVPTLGTATFIKTYTIACEVKNTVYTIHSLTNNGNYRTVHCNKVSELSMDIKRNTFKKLPFVIGALGTVSYPYESEVEQVLNVETTDKYKLTTDWITEAESLLYKQIVSSPSIFLDLGTGQGYLSVRCTDGSYNIRKRYPDGLFNATFQLEVTHSDSTQSK